MDKDFFLAATATVFLGTMLAGFLTADRPYEVPTASQIESNQLTEDIRIYPENISYSILKPNHRTWIIRGLYGQNITPYLVETNSEGIREKDIRGKKNSTRILVLGDSFTYGWGVNSSERFTERIEDHFQNTEVIAAGVPGWGFREHYLFYNRTDEKYDPEIVIIAFHTWDIIDENLDSRFREKAEKKVPKNVENRESKIVEKKYRLRAAYLQKNDLKATNFSHYLGGIEEIAKEDKAELYMTPYLDLEKKWRQEFTDYTDSNYPLYLPLKRELREGNRTKYSISNTDPHYNPLGHRLLAEGIITGLENRSEVLENKTG